MDRVEMVGKASESWNRYVDAHGEEFPGLRNVRSPEELNSFFSSHPEASVLKDQTPSSVFDDLRYASSTANVRNSEVASLVEASGSGVPKQEIPGTESFGHTLGGSAELLKDFFDRPPTMEDDLDYQGLRWSKEDEFKQKRRDLIDQAIADHAKEYKDKGANIHDLSDDDLLLLHPEGARYTHEAQLDYLYGSLDGKEAGIDTDTRDEFTRHMNEELEKKGPGFLGQREKLRRKKERWDKYDTSETGDVRRDPELRRFQFELEQARLGREDSEFAKWQLANPKGSWKQYHASSEYANFMDRMHQNSMNRYIKKHPKKALAYAKDAKTRLKNDPKATIHPHLKGITDAVDRHASFLQENLPDEYTEYTEFFSSPREKNQRSSFEPQERATGGNGASSFHYPTTGQGRQNNNNSLLGKANNKLNQVKNTAKNIKGLANDAKQIAELAQKLKYLNPYVLAAIGIAALIILIIVIIVAITDPSQNTNQTATGNTPPPIGISHTPPPYYPTPAPGQTITQAYQQALQSVWGVSFTDSFVSNRTCGSFNQQELVWAWQKLWDVSGTKFPSLVKDHATFAPPKVDHGCWSVITCGPSSCLINFNHYADQETFNIIFTHELSHSIEGTQPSIVSKFPTILGAILGDRISGNGQYIGWFGGGFVTHYSANAGAGNCGGGNPISEDYAEMLTYYLNPNSGEHTLCAGGQPNPYANGQHQIHLNLARSIIGTY